MTVGLPLFLSVNNSVHVQYLDDLASVPQSASQSLLDILTDRVHGNAKTTSNDELYVDGVPFSLLLISTVTFIVAMYVETNIYFVLFQVPNKEVLMVTGKSKAILMKLSSLRVWLLKLWQHGQRN